MLQLIAIVAICKEDGSISMGDEAVKIFLNAKGTLDDVSDELKAFLDYVAGKKPKDVYVERLEEAVKGAKKNERSRKLFQARISALFRFSFLSLPPYSGEKFT
jgi:hypothetical protein